jgi:hypothetical protein
MRKGCTIVLAAALLGMAIPAAPLFAQDASGARIAQVQMQEYEWTVVVKYRESKNTNAQKTLTYKIWATYASEAESRAQSQFESEHPRWIFVNANAVR